MREYKSRLSEVEEQKSIKSALVFGGLTVLIIIFAILFGIPLFSRFINLFSKNSTTVTSSQNSNLLPPNLSVLPQYTNQKSIIVKGTSAPNSTIKIFFGNSSDETSSDENGNFAANIGLSKGANVIYTQTLDKNGNQSAKSTIYTVNFTDQIPNLTVNVPQNNQIFYGSSQQNLNIQGSTDASNTITINDHIAVLDNTGKFNYPFNLQNGDNNLKIISTDPAGNKKEIDLKVTFNP
jgi:glucodextranase-like protein